ncbi:MAG: hypothetical protein Ct9H90mP30_7010 [Actinomycetota bacterium]|nr:MAG: hypothetical protein Ct9H90mP30_7010 [Actinomycetota bacterium]
MQSQRVSLPVKSNGPILASPKSKTCSKRKGNRSPDLTGTGAGGEKSHQKMSLRHLNKKYKHLHRNQNRKRGLKKPLPTLSSIRCEKNCRTARVDLTKVKASGPGGRITKQDVFAPSRTHGKTTNTPRTSRLPIWAGKRTPIKGMRAIIADRMHSSLQEMANSP